MSDGAPFLRWWCYGILAASIAATPYVLHMAGEAVRGHQNRVADWLPETYEETRQLVWFRERFVADQFLIISWDGCRLGETAEGDDPRIERLTGLLEASAIPGTDGERCFQSVTNGRRLLGELTEGPSEIPEAEAVDRLRGSMVGADGRQTCVMAVLSDASVERMRDVLARPMPPTLLKPATAPTPLFAAIAEAGLKPGEARLGGPPIDNMSIDEEGQKTLAKLAVYSGLLGLGLAWWSLRSVRMTVLVFACGLGSAALSLAMVPLTGARMDAIMMSMPSMVYVLAVSGALHYLNYYKACVWERGLAGAAYDAAAHAWRPALLCAVTTSCGLLSLLVSDITPIKRFGGYSAAGVLATLVVLFGFLPAVLDVWGWTPRRRGSDDAAPIDSPFWRGFARAIERRVGLVLTVSVLVIVGLAAGLPRTTTSIDLLKLFSGDAQLLKDYQWFEERLGKLIPAEVVVRFPPRLHRESAPDSATPRTVAASLSFIERLEVVRLVESTVRKRLGPEGLNLVGATMSPATFAPDLEGQRGVSRRFAVNEELLKARAELERSGYLRTDRETGEELWRITVRCAAFHSGERDEIVERLREAVEPVLIGTQAGSSSLAQLSRFDEEDAAPPQVAVYAPRGLDDATRAATDLARRRGVRVSVLDKPIREADDRTRDALRQRDLLLVAAGGEGDMEQLTALDRPVRMVTTAGAANDIGVVYTGVLPIVYKAQRELLNSLVESTWWSFATVAPLMIFVCRSLWGGLLVMLPNALPVLLVFGGMAWMGAAVDIGSMMGASIALGVAVDDTIHFLAWYRDDVRRLGCRGEAIVSAYQRSAAPTLQAGLVNGLGLAVFALSTFVPTQRFGLLMLAILGAGIVAELVLLPALLFSPLGRVFDPSTRSFAPEPRHTAERTGSDAAPSPA